MFIFIFLIKVNGRHTSEDVPPRIPFFAGLKASRTTLPATTGPQPTTAVRVQAIPASTSTNVQSNEQADVEKKVLGLGR